MQVQLAPVKYKALHKRIHKELTSSGKKVVPQADTLVIYFTDEPLKNQIPRDWKGTQIIAAGKKPHIPGMRRRPLKAKTPYFKKFFLYKEELESYDVGDFTFPTGLGRRWIRVREMENLPPRLLNTIEVPIRKVKSKYLSPFERSFNKELAREIYYSILNRSGAVSYHELESFLAAKRKSFLSGWEILERCDRGESFQVDMSHWPLKYVPIEHLQWIMYDGEHKDPAKKKFKPYGIFKERVQEWLLMKENDKHFRKVWAVSGIGIPDEPNFVEDFAYNGFYPTGRWNEKNEFENIGTSIKLRWPGHGYTPIPDEEVEIPEETDLQGGLSSRMVIQDTWTEMITRHYALIDVPEKKAPENPEEAMERTRLIINRASEIGALWKRYMDRHGFVELNEKDSRDFECARQEALDQLDLMKSDLAYRLDQVLEACGEDLLAHEAWSQIASAEKQVTRKDSEEDYRQKRAVQDFIDTLIFVLTGTDLLHTLVREKIEIQEQKKKLELEESLPAAERRLKERLWKEKSEVLHAAWKESLRSSVPLVNKRVPDRLWAEKWKVRDLVS